MGVGSFKAIVTGRSGACHAFLSSVTPRCYDWDVDWAGGSDEEYEIRFSGSTKHLLMLPFFGRHTPAALDVPDDLDEARKFGAETYRSHGESALSIQERSALFGVEVQLTQTDDEAREEDGDELAYVHYVNGEKQPDCWGSSWPKALDMPVGGMWG